MKEMGNTYKIVIEEHAEKEHLVNLSIDGR
jgi:hypothetical protein